MAPDDTVNFSGNNNQGFQLGVNQGTIGDIVFNFKEANDKCLNDLRLTNPRDDKERIKNTKGGLLEGSYKWILGHLDFQRWRNDDQCRLLWVEGDPGKGKTMLLIGIVDELERQLAQLKQAEQSTSPTVLSYFFCQGNDTNLNNAKAILRGLIYLLAIQQPSLASNLREEYEHSSGKLFEDTNAFVALSRILMGMLRDPTLTRAYIIIDALDECETGLLQLLKLIVEYTSASRVKWIISSRNKHDIKQQLNLADYKVKLSLELNPESIAAAVNVYICYKVSQLTLLKGYDSRTEDTVKEYLRAKADNTFFWVALVCENLEKIRPKKTRSALKAFPPGLDPLYGRMMQQILSLEDPDDAYLCKRILATVALVYRPVTLAELASLVRRTQDTSDGTQSSDGAESSDDPESLEEVIGLCGSFLTMRDGRVYIIHQSANDYLRGKGAPISPLGAAEADHKKFVTSLEAKKKIFPFGPARAHRDISLRSLQAMLKTLRRDIYNLRHPGLSIDDLKMPVPDPLASVRYSCVHWVHHLCEAPQRNDLVDGGLVHKFLEGYLLYWAEASSLLGALIDAVLAVGNLERLLKTMFSESSLLSLTVDAHRFLLHNGLVIKNAPLQTYVSALLFSPAGSLTRELFRKEEPQWVLTGPAVDTYWSPLVRTLKGHGCSVWSVAFSPDGKLIASGSGDETIKVWDATTGEAKHTLEGHCSFYSVSFDTTGLYLFTNIGYTKVDALHQIDAKVPVQSQPQTARQCGYSLDPDKSWITWDGHKVLWLPSEYRPSERESAATWQPIPTSTVARVAIGCDMGRVIVISFSKPPPALPLS